ncbi:MAG: DNA-binding protein [Candidatus Binatia bacterium]
MKVRLGFRSLLCLVGVAAMLFVSPPESLGKGPPLGKGRKKGELPPGQQKQIEQKGKLPPGVQKQLGREKFPSGLKKGGRPVKRRQKGIGAKVGVHRTSKELRQRFEAKKQELREAIQRMWQAKTKDEKKRLEVEKNLIEHEKNALEEELNYLITGSKGITGN